MRGLCGGAIRRSGGREPLLHGEGLPTVSDEEEGHTGPNSRKTNIGDSSGSGKEPPQLVDKP